MYKCPDWDWVKEVEQKHNFKNDAEWNPYPKQFGEIPGLI